MKTLDAYLGVDLGTHCGFARYDQLGKGGSYMTGAWDFSITRFDSPHIRYERFGKSLDEQFTLGITKVFYEKVQRHLGTTAAHVYGAFLNKLHEKCAEYGVPFEGLSVQEIKLFATGKGNAKKDKVGLACVAWGFAPKSDDEADAIAILKCGMETKL
jgi:Holliday junction resolvasome RuvABC endonuclease subunit